MKSVFILFLFLTFGSLAHAEGRCGRMGIEFDEGMNVPIGYNEIDFDGDGKEDTLRVVMSSGCYLLPQLPDSIESMLEGQFTFHIWKKGIPIQSLNQMLNKGGDLTFRNKGFKLFFQDYNDDGKRDFSVCTFGVSTYAGNNCTILTVDSNGIISPISETFFVNTSAFSSREIEKVERGVIRASDFHAGSGHMNYYKWNGKKFEFLKSVEQ